MSKSGKFRSNDEPSDVERKFRKSPDVSNGSREIHESSLEHGIEAGWIEERRSKPKATLLGLVQEVQAKDDWRFRGIIGKANKMVREEPKQVRRSKEGSPDTEAHDRRKSFHNSDDRRHQSKNRMSSPTKKEVKKCERSESRTS